MNCNDDISFALLCETQNQQTLTEGFIWALASVQQWFCNFPIPNDSERRPDCNNLMTACEERANDVRMPIGQMDRQTPLWVVTALNIWNRDQMLESKPIDSQDQNRVINPFDMRMGKCSHHFK